MKHVKYLFQTGAAILFIVAQLTQAAENNRITPTVKSRQSQKVAPKKEVLEDLLFEETDLDIVMELYCELTERIMLKTDSVKASISMKARNLTKKERIEAIEAVLAMNNIALIPVGEKFLKVVLASQPDLTGQGLMFTSDPELTFSNTDEFVTHVIQLQHIEFQEIQAAIQHLMHSFGKIQTLERKNSMMITDTSANMQRILDLIEFMDQPSAQIEPRIYQLQYAEASQIASKLNEIIQMAQADQKAGTSTRSSVKTPPGVMRARSTQTAQASVSRTETGSTVIIQGTVKVMSDERTNIIMIFSEPDNFGFFDNIIKVFDVEVEPETTYEVVYLEYADAEELSGILNELIGAAQNKSSTGSAPSTTRPTTSTSSAIRSLRPTPTVSKNDEKNLSKLSENTKIIADKRSNALILTGRTSDIGSIKSIISNLDVMLEQVIIEVAIFEIGLNNGISHGIEWLYKSQDGNKLGAWDGAGLLTNALATVASSALSYGQVIPGLNTTLAINMAATDGNSRVLATPVIMTTDNTEATLSIGEQRPVVTATSSYSSYGSSSSNYEYKDIGIQLTVTPRINPERFVLMEIQQKADQLGDPTTIDGNEVPVILNREFEASIAVPDQGTVVLGGIVTSEFTDSVNKIPILGDIPLIGRYLFSSVQKSERQRELMVLLTPRVMTTETELIKATERLYKATNIGSQEWPGGDWSESKLRDIPLKSDETEIPAE